MLKVKINTKIIVQYMYYNSWKALSRGEGGENWMEARNKYTTG